MAESLRLTALQLRVPQLARSVEFYAQRLGFVVTAQTPQRAELAVAAGAAPILTLLAAVAAPSAGRDTAGLFHAAMLLPDRPALATWLAHAAARNVEFEGFSDHGVSEAIYLSDPDGNGLEFYADRPRAEWPFADGELAMTTKPLNLRALLADAAPASAEPLAGARWGHLHLRVTELERSEAFYRTQLGVAVTQRSYPGARFLAADGYHHHVALNTWGTPRTPQPAGALGLAEATFIRPGSGAAVQLTDPDGLHLRVLPG